MVLQAMASNAAAGSGRHRLIPSKRRYLSLQEKVDVIKRCSVFLYKMCVRSLIVAQLKFTAY